MNLFSELDEELVNVPPSNRFRTHSTKCVVGILLRKLSSIIKT